MRAPIALACIDGQITAKMIGALGVDIDGWLERLDGQTFTIRCAGIDLVNNSMTFDQRVNPKVVTLELVGCNE